ncbi:MAG: SGNH/GDSL hydrolase family protein [Ignavibacteriaceae bacterium]|nr:SGNH/GDSL hydrolase family protein [Ignavibacteriaceae bacterium]
MKKILNVLFGFSLITFIFVGCEDRSDLTAPTSGTASYDRFVTIGNSITAGYQSGALYESAQNYAYGNLIAKQVGSSFAMPIYSDPGTGGRMELTAFNFATSTPTITNNPAVGAPTNLGYAAPYNNLGVPGAILYDVLNATNSQDCGSKVFGGPANPMFDLILRNSALNIGSQFKQAKALNPTLLTVWIGNNDVLGFATSGGASPSSPTASATFDALYRFLADSLKSLNTKVVVANLPDVTAIPFFNTVGPKLALGAPWTANKAAGSNGLYYVKHGVATVDPTVYADSISLLTGKVDLTLVAGSWTGYLGQPTGAWYRYIAASKGLPLAAVLASIAGLDTTKAFGFHPQNPFPDALTLDADEITTAKTATLNFNTSIDSLARNRGFGFVNVNSFFNAIRAKDYTGGTYYGGIKFTTGYISGGLFSLDGVHPSNHAHAIIANEFIKVINTKWGGNIPQVDVASITPSIILGKRISFDHFGIPKYPAGAFDHLLY